MLTVVTSLQAQQRDVLDFLTHAIHAAALGRSTLTYCLNPLLTMKPLWLPSPLNLYPHSLTKGLKVAKDGMCF